MASFTIALTKLRFFAQHGLFEEERLVGNEFEVTIHLKVKAPKERVTTLEQTINYGEIFTIVKERFATPTSLLETLATELADAIHIAFPSVKKISVQISKLHPPIPGFVGSVSVKYQMKY